MRLIILFTSITLFFSSCVLCGGVDDDFDNVSIPVTCFETLIPAQTDFQNEPGAAFTLNSFVIDGDFLKMNVGISGCDLDRNFKLLVSPFKSKTNPPQQEAKLSFEEQPCSAFLLTELCFDISILERPTVLKIETNNGTQSLLIE